MFPLWRRRKASLFQVSFCFGIEPSSLHPPPLHPAHPVILTRVRHCGEGTGINRLDAWPQIRPARCLNGCVSNPQGSRLTGNSHGRWEEITMFRCVWGVIATTRPLRADEFLSRLTSLIHLCSHTDTR